MIQLDMKLVFFNNVPPNECRNNAIFLTLLVIFGFCFQTKFSILISTFDKTEITLLFSQFAFSFCLNCQEPKCFCLTLKINNKFA